MEIKCPHQCFINNEFVDSTGGKLYNTINPNDESVICQVSAAQKEDVEKAVQAAKVREGTCKVLSCRKFKTLNFHFK